MIGSIVPIVRRDLKYRQAMRSEERHRIGMGRFIIV